MDEAREWTDKELEGLERRIYREYYQAEREMRGKQAKWLEQFEREREMREKALDDTKEAMEAHQRWLESQTLHSEWFDSMIEGLTKSAHQANVKAMGMVNDSLPKVFSENANMAAFSIDKALEADTRFALVNEDAVRYLMGIRTEGVDSTQLVRETAWFQADEGRDELQDVRKRLQEVRGQKVDYAKDIRWNRQKFTSAITQGILQGESIPNIVKRTKSIYGQNRSAAIRAARTATTNVENAGRMSSFERAQRLGIDMEIEWEATLDGRTRDSHRALDGERIKLGETFSNGLRWPGDPQGPGWEVWNCRCRANGRVVGFDGKRGDWADDVSERWSRLPEGMTYEQWKAGKAVSRSVSYENEWNRVLFDREPNSVLEGVTTPHSGIAEGRDILKTWQRREEDFDFEIEDVMAAQGFDGKPRIVSADEFDRAVKEANGGDGLVMQRSYSAPDQITLDAYRDMLYDGKWYVDCSTGGSQYGQGMYAAADYTGKVTADMQKEMRHYTTLNQGRLGAQPLSDEGKEAFLRRWVGENVDEADRDAASTYLKFESHTGDVAWADVGKAVEHLGEEKRLSLLESGVHEDVHQMLDGYSYVETMTLDPSARIIEYEELTKMHRLGAEEYISAKVREQENVFFEIFGKNMDADTKASIISDVRETYRDMDMGSYAAALGYDAINAVGHGASGSYTVVLNRTKLIIRRPE